MQITPNVLRAGGFVRLSSTPAQLPVKIYDRNGRVVAEPLVENEVLTLPRNIKQGVYFLNIAGSAARYKLVVVE